MDVVISDTVGFIRKLPHQLVDAFKATLEELEYADLLLHVIDVSNPSWQEQARVVDKLIGELGAEQTPCLRVYNKSDLFWGDDRPRGEDAVSISAKTGEGLPALLEAIDRALDKVESVEYAGTIDVTAVCNPKAVGVVKPYIEGWTEPKEPWE